MERPRSSGEKLLSDALVAATASAAGLSGVPTSAATSLRLIAALAEHRAVAARLKGHCRLLAASGTNHSSSLGCSGTVAAATTAIATTVAATTALLFVLLCLTARFAPFGRGIAPVAEKCLIVCRKSEVLSTVAAGKLYIPSHKNSSLMITSSRLESSCVFCNYLSRAGEKRPTESLNRDWVPLIIALPPEMERAK